MSGKLNAAAIRNGLPTGKHADGQGMYLEITGSGGKYWRMKYRIDKKEKNLRSGSIQK